LATGTSVVGISTLQLMAEEAAHALARTRNGRPLAITVDAHRGQVYSQAFAADGSAETPPQLLTLDEAASRAASESVIFAGSGAAAVAALATAAGYSAEAALPALQPNAAFLLLAAQKCEPQSQPLRPLYLRPADAKPQASKSLARAIA
jgi:tRNA A37 threonylcarbamoyladenosine modification protein TsaB